MVSSLQARKESLEAKIIEKTEELKKLCLQEAELTGVLPPETPLEPGEPLPQIRRRVGTSFSFPQNLINSEDALNALELECRVQNNIAEAALALANDPSANKAARKKHRLMYRQSQRRLTELETRLTLLKQGKPQTTVHIKKKPRPQTTSVDHTQFYYNGGSDWFQSLQRHSRSSESSNSPRMSTASHAFNNPGLPEVVMTPSRSHPNIQGVEFKRGRQWDSQSLLPSQTYPDHSLSRTQSLSNVDVSPKPKEKEWYETSLDAAAPSPPLRTSSKLPTTARLVYHMQEMQIRDAVSRSLAQQPDAQSTRNQLYTSFNAQMQLQPIEYQLPHPSLSRTRRDKQQKSHKPLQRTDVYIDIPEDSVDSPSFSSGGAQTPTTPYFHSSPSWQPGDDLPGFHPPHAITQEEIQFDTVVPFESPQNHTVVQAGKWQPYREVTKPFEMSDFYKYSTKFRAHRASVTPSPAPHANVAIYQPLQPMTCQPVERSSYFDTDNGQ